MSRRSRGLLREAELAVNTDPQAPTVAVNGHDVTDAIRHPDVSAAVSAIATNLDVRRELVSRQRELITGAAGGIVAEGRDITTVVAPDAQVRVLLVADPAARVARRHAELGERIDAAAVTDQVIRRDHDDSTVAQFHSAGPGVVVLDSTSLSLEEVIDAICAARPRVARASSRRCESGRGWGGRGAVIAGVSPDLPHTAHLPVSKELGLRLMKPVAAAIIRSYWQVHLHGEENVPPTGAAILAANHIGDTRWPSARGADSATDVRPREA